MNDGIASILDKVSVIHTLGPSGTNCEAAANYWFEKRGKEGKVFLHETLEAAIETMPNDSTCALLGCVVYPKLHDIVFRNLKRMTLAECFMFPTFNMLLASKDGTLPRTVSSHPAPVNLVPNTCKVRLVNSNAQAAIDCVRGITEGCITTLPAAMANGLKIVKDFGPIPMGFSIHINHPVLTVDPVAQ